MSDVVNLEPSPVIRITLPYLFDLANRLGPLKQLTAGKVRDKHELYSAEVALKGLLMQSVYSAELRNCVQSAQNLLQNISSKIDSIGVNQDAEFSQVDAMLIRFAYEDFETIFMSEIGVWPAYFVTRKGPYDTLTLLDNGQVLFPDELGAKVPEAIFDAQEAAKALAFECCTAAGFHVYRCLESVLRRYWEAETQGQAHPKVRSIGVYVRAMERGSVGDAKVIAALDQINKLDRNPLIHPEVVLDLDEIMNVVGITRTAISRMLRSLPNVPPTTTMSHP